VALAVALLAASRAEAFALLALPTPPMKVESVLTLRLMWR
jgi:hypothetical protein